MAAVGCLVWLSESYSISNKAITLEPLPLQVLGQDMVISLLLKLVFVAKPYFLSQRYLEFFWPYGRLGKQTSVFVTSQDSLSVSLIFLCQEIFMEKHNFRWYFWERVKFGISHAEIKNFSSRVPVRSRVGDESTRFPRMCPGFDFQIWRPVWFEFVCSLLFIPPERFFSGPDSSLTLLQNNQYLIWMSFIQSYLNFS